MGAALTQGASIAGATAGCEASHYQPGLNTACAEPCIEADSHELQHSQDCKLDTELGVI